MVYSALHDVFVVYSVLHDVFMVYNALHDVFQEQNGILLPSLRPALPFLDLHSVARNEFHQTTMEELRDKLMARVGELAQSNDKDRLIVYLGIHT